MKRHEGEAAALAARSRNIREIHKRMAKRGRTKALCVFFRSNPDEVDRRGMPATGAEMHIPQHEDGSLLEEKVKHEVVAWQDPSHTAPDTFTPEIGPQREVGLGMAARWVLDDILNRHHHGWQRCHVHGWMKFRPGDPGVSLVFTETTERSREEEYE